MTVKLRQVWTGLEVTVINDLDRPLFFWVNIHVGDTNILTNGGLTLPINAKWSKIFGKEQLDANAKARGITIQPGAELKNTVDWRITEPSGTYKLETSNVIVYQIIMVPAEVLIIPAEIITGVAIINFIK